MTVYRLFSIYIILTAGLCSGRPDDPLPPKQTFQTQDELVLDGSHIAHQPGDTFAIAAGKLNKLTLRNFKGTADKPVVFVNKGLVDINRQDRGGALDIIGCEHLRLTGTGPAEHSPSKPVSGINCGFRVCAGEKSPHAVNVIGRSSCIEIDHIEIYGAGFAGFNVKDEPRTDGTTNRDNFTMYNISLHDNHVHHTNGEGFYVGHTFFHGYDPKKTGNPLFPHVIKGLRLYNNYIHDTGCEGIQVGSVVEDCEIYNNTVLRTGARPFAQWQNNGIQIGIGTRAKFYNNYIRDVPGNGLQTFGWETVYIYNNLFANVGGNGSYIRTNDVQTLYYLHNTFANIEKEGILIGNWRKPPAKVVLFNNIIVAKENGIHDQNRNVKSEQAGNVIARDVREAGFIDAAGNDFRLSANSPAQNTANPITLQDIQLDRPNPKTPGAAGFEPNRAPRTEKPPTPWLNPQ